jgi:hypothetical protein
MSTFGQKNLAEPLYAGAMWLLDRERPFDAVHFFRAMLLDTPADERAWLGLGACHEHLGQRDVARDVYLTGTIAASRRAKCMIALSRLFRRDGDVDTMNQLLDEASPFAFTEGVTSVLDAERELR